MAFAAVWSSLSDKQLHDRSPDLLPSRPNGTSSGLGGKSVMGWSAGAIPFIPGRETRNVGGGA